MLPQLLPQISAVSFIIAQEEWPDRSFGGHSATAQAALWSDAKSPQKLLGPCKRAADAA